MPLLWREAAVRRRGALRWLHARIGAASSILSLIVSWEHNPACMKVQHKASARCNVKMQDVKVHPSYNTGMSGWLAAEQSQTMQARKPVTGQTLCWHTLARVQG